MAKSSKPRKKTNLKAKHNLRSIRNIQIFMRDFSIAGEMSDPTKTLMFRKSRPVAKTKATSDAFYNIRFQWTILVGVLGRTQTGELYTKQVQLTTNPNDPVLADEINDFVRDNLRKIWHSFNPLHRLTGFYVCTPADTVISDTLVAQLLHTYKTPDNIYTKYEIDTNTEPKIVCDDTIWEQLYTAIKWTEISNYQPPPLQFKRLTPYEREQQRLKRELEALEQRVRNGTQIPRLFKRATKKANPTSRSITSKFRRAIRRSSKNRRTSQHSK